MRAFFSSIKTPDSSTIRAILIMSALFYGVGCVRGYWILCVPYPLIAFYFLRATVHGAFRWLWLSGLLCMLLCVQWMMEINTTSWGITTNAETMAFMILFWVLCALILSFGWIVIILIWKLKPFSSNEPIKLAIWFAGAFAVSEWVRSVFFSLILYGQGATIGSHWSFGSLGLMMAGSPLAGLTRLFGMYGTTFVVITFCLLSLEYIKQKKWKKLGTAGIIITCLVGLSLLYGTRLRPLQSTVTMVNFPLQRNHTNTLDERLSPNYVPPNAQNQIIFLPEYSGVAGAKDQSTEKEFLSRLSSASDVVYIDAYKVYGQSGPYNELGLFRGDKKEQSSLKKFLIPFGEYMPYLTKEIFKITGNRDILGQIEKDNLRSSATDAQPLDFNGNLYGTLACSGAIAPELYRDLVNKNADVLVSTADLGFFYQSQSYYAQQRVFARFQAVSQARPFVQSTRQGPSIAVDANGAILSYLNGTSDIGVSNLELKTSKTKTPYTLFGEWVVYGLMLFAVIAILSRFLKSSNA